MPNYTIELAEPAERVYRRLYREAQACIEAGQESNAKVTLFRMVEEAITKIIPHDPFSPQRALSGQLSNIFRVRKGRIRICYAGSPKQNRIVILFISERPRKHGDVHDPYAVFTRLWLSGKHDSILELLGIRRSRRGASTPFSPPRKEP